jgi:hypothetical protein
MKQSATVSILQLFDVVNTSPQDQNNGGEHEHQIHLEPKGCFGLAREPVESEKVVYGDKDEDDECEDLEADPG